MLQTSGDYDFGALLKKLDGLDEDQHCPENIKSSSQKSSVMSALPDTADDDFDNSDEDLASLLADDDDDDDIFAKKTFPKSPPKKPGDEKSHGISSGKSMAASQSEPKGSISNVAKSFASKPNLPKSEDLRLKQSSSDAMSPKTPRRSSLKSKSSAVKTADKESDDEEDDFLKSLESNDVPSTPKRRGSFFDSFLKTLSPKKSSKTAPALDSLHEKKADESKKDNDSEDDDILKSLESNNLSTASRKKSDSCIDDFLKSTSPVQSPKKTAVLRKKDSLEDLLDSKLSDKKRNEVKKDEEEEDIFNSFLSSDIKKSKPPVQKHSTPENKRETFQRQVSFKDIPISSPELSPVKSKSPISPKKQPEPVTSALKTKPATQPRRSEKLGASKKDNTDWLNFFKDIPAENQPSKEQSVKESTTKSVVGDIKVNVNRRKSSSAEWLGLNDTTFEENAAEKIESSSGKITRDSSLDWLKSEEPIINPRPKSTHEISTKPRIPNRPQTSSLDWLGNTNTAAKSDKIPEIVNPSSKIFKKDVIEIAREAGDIAIPNSQGGINAFKPRDTFPSNMQIESSQKISDVNIQNKTVISEHAYLKSAAHTTEPAQIPVNMNLASSLNSESSVNGLQTIMNNHLLERNQLLNSLESTKIWYEERIATMENLHRNQLKTLDEALQSEKTKHKLEIDGKVKNSEENFEQVQKEKNKLETGFKTKLEDVEKEHSKEVQRLKDLQSQSVALMKQDHEDALLRLKRLKEQEIEAVLSTQVQSRSLQHLTEQLEARATELASLQAKVEEKNQGNLREKQALLVAKEQDLKNLQNRLERQLEAGDDERTRLQQLVLRLESRLQKYTAEGEEDRWDMQQLKAKLLVQQKHLDEEYKLNMQQVEKQKEKLRLAQDSLLHEQKTVLLQMAQERQLLMQEKLDMEMLAKKVKEDEIKFNVKKLKEEAFIERQRQFLQQEESRLHSEKSSFRQESDFLEQEREALQREKKMLLEERARLGELSFKLRRKESEVEAKEMWATEERERSKVENSVVQNIKMDQQSKMQQITQKMHELMEKEHQILAEKEGLTAQRLELQKEKNTTLCNKCRISLGFPVNAPPLMNTKTAAVTSVNNNIPAAEYPISNLISNHLALPRTDPSLVVWYVTAQKDREYLQEELLFLQSLKDTYKK